ncbi:MAG: phosphoribosylaminoimidazole-succinocarboxamide synthase [Actinomycetota bacterium]|jgi:phosphoribosylaminoimidazole-succinocarboxamide synthase|nr:phosphoribosylaminoimidazole-succinocarboxamide synthase [Actinomycetota bacterium]
MPTAIRAIGSGKVRDIYAVGDDQLLLVASDRISAFDVVLPQAIPDKGRVLTGLSAYWFAELDGVCPNHFISAKTSDFPESDLTDLDGRATLCVRAEPLPIEFVVRGYITGSGWKDYQKTGEICGHKLPAGLEESERLPEPLLTPATKATEGHDINITEDEARDIAGKDRYDTARTYALELYEKGSALALERGVIMADTKFEFGVHDGEVILIDEVLTPDSSRFWPEDEYKAGRSQPSFDKQYVRDWLDQSGWDHSPPPPELPADVVDATRARYIEAFEKVSRKNFEDWLSEVAG